MKAVRTAREPGNVAEGIGPVSRDDVAFSGRL